MPHNTDSSFAFLRLPDGEMVFGLGPFKHSKTPPRSGYAFYVNDFSLAESHPWKIPQRILSAKEFLQLPLAQKPLQLKWQELGQAGFAEVFKHIQSLIASNQLSKAVPVLSHQAEILQGNPCCLAISALQQPSSMYSYAWFENGKGFIGVTPELLFSQQRGQIHTMALAGTAPAEEQQAFSCNQKEIHEHELVCDYLTATLAPHGHLQRQSRQILELGELIHFKSEFILHNPATLTEEFWLRLLHPTPALGIVPRSSLSLQQLLYWRKQLNAPAHFGAPFGCWYHGQFSAVVAIRGVHFDQQRLSLASGCGIVAGSDLQREWQELALKRRSCARRLNFSYEF